MSRLIGATPRRRGSPVAGLPGLLVGLAAALLRILLVPKGSGGARAGIRSATATAQVAPAARQVARPRIGERTWPILEAAAVCAIFGAFLRHLLPMLSVPSVYSDSGNALSISRTLAHGQLGTVWSTQSPLLQDAIYALLLRLNRSDLLDVPVVMSSLGLALLLGAMLYRLTRVRTAIALPALVLMFSDVFWLQTGYLPLYAGFALLGYAGLYYCVAYQIAGGALWRPVVGALLLTLALHTFTTALVFVLVPAIALISFPSRAAFRRSAIVHVMIGCLASPWLIWHLYVGGPTRIYYHPLNWFTTKYLPIVNDEFWQFPRQSLLSYVHSMGEVGLTEVVAPSLLWLAPVGLWYVRKLLGARAAAFCILNIVAYCALLAVTRPAPYSRYFFPVLPLVVFLIAAGIVYVVALVAAPSASRDLMGRAARSVVVPGAVIAGIVLLVHPPSAVSDAHALFIDRLATSKGYAGLEDMANVIDGHPGGIIGRDAAIQPLLPANQSYTHFLLDEPDYVAYLSWPNDQAVISMFRRHDIRWVIIRNDTRWEDDYNVWLVRAYGLRPRHYELIGQSPNFTLAYRNDVYSLYHLNDSAVASQATAPHP